MKAILRLCEAASVEQEWAYLVNESLAGEITIVPLLEDFLRVKTLSIPFREMIRRQIGEEVDHVERYERLFGQKNYKSSGYDKELLTYVRNINNCTLRIYALQSILESISLGALLYRAKAMPESPSSVDDQVVLQDEIGHTRFGMAFIRELIGNDGKIPLDPFRIVTKQMNAIFTRHFNGPKISNFFRDNYNIRTLDHSQIDRSHAMTEFRRISTGTVVKHKNIFLRKYQLSRSELKSRQHIIPSTREVHI